MRSGLVLLTALFLAATLSVVVEANGSCLCKKEVAGPQVNLGTEDFTITPSAVVDEKRGNYFLVQSHQTLNGTILSSIGSVLTTTVISSEPARGPIPQYFSVAYDSSKDRYLVVWIAPDPSGGRSFPIHGQFVDAETGNPQGPRLEFKKGKEITKVQLLYNRINKQYLLGYEVADPFRSTFFLQRTFSNGHAIGSPTNLKIHASNVSIKQDPLKNRFLIAFWNETNFVFNLFFQVVNAKLEPISSRKIIPSSVNQQIVYSPERKSFVLFWVSTTTGAHFQARLVAPDGEYASEIIPLFHAAQVFGVSTDSSTRGFVVLYPHYINSSPDLWFARIREDFSIEEKGIPVACENLFRPTGQLLTNPLDSEFVAIWSGKISRVSITNKSLFQRIRALPTGTCP